MSDITTADPADAAQDVAGEEIDSTKVNKDSVFGHRGSSEKLVVVDTTEKTLKEVAPKPSARPGGGSDLEFNLQHRDKVGVQDFVLLDNYRSEPAFVDNLKKRFKENIIYTYIGHVLISVNPYKNLPIYSEEDVKLFTKKHFFEAPPHIFAIVDNAYRSLVFEHREQCILISGESGSGKTEASKKVLEYIAARTGHLKNVETVKDKLLQSNPVLEAFGNSKTNRNDNSSRFGKYMDVQFNYEGGPQGANILDYLLEKSRVVGQAAGERNFHIFYQLLAGADPHLLKSLHLQNSPDEYRYTSQVGTNSGARAVASDSAQFQMVRHALSVLGLADEEERAVLVVVAAVLHLGNVTFVTNKHGDAEVLLHDRNTELVAELVGCAVDTLRAALTGRTISARGDVVHSPLSPLAAAGARDALAKALYAKLFVWLVARLNRELRVDNEINRNTISTSVIGILDIYGFEIFNKNSFEQFCINFCNEKLQQLFIELTLKSEQEEYLKEGIEWEPVEYFNNFIICQLIEERHKGLISLLDEECLRPGARSDLGFLHKANSQLGQHAHYVSHNKADTKKQKIMGRDEFCLVHYAGDVTYNVTGFLEKNNDPLSRDLRELLQHSTNLITGHSFSVTQMEDKRRPETTATQFKSSLSDLVTILSSKEPSYIRCIKPNDDKKPGVFDDALVTHQVKYLGLMENLRVRRAGFAYRRLYNMFLERYKCLSAETWPNYRGDPKEGVQKLVAALGYRRDDYRMGNTKIFIRFPKTLFDTEDAFQAKKHDIATLLQSRWKGLVQRRRYLHMRHSAIVIQKWIRRFLAQKHRERRKWAANVIRDFIKGFITRNGEESVENKRFLAIAKVHWLKRLSKSLPCELLDLSWPACPVTCQEASRQLQRAHRLHLARKYRRALSPDDKTHLELKVLAEFIFKGKKSSYAASIGARFQDSRLDLAQEGAADTFVASPGLPGDENIVYRTAVTKYDRHGYKPRSRVLLLSSRALYLLASGKGATVHLKHRLPLERLQLVVSGHSDGLLLVKIPADLKRDKGDLILALPNLIEGITKLTSVTKNPGAILIVDTGSISHELVSGKPGGVIEVTTGSHPNIHRAKSGNLLVVAGP